VVGSLSWRHQPFAGFGSLEGRSVLPAGGYGEVQVWEAATGRAIGRPFAAHGDVVAVAMGGDDGALLAAISRSGHLTIWDAATRIRLHDIDLPDGGFRSLAMGRLHDPGLLFTQLHGAEVGR
jgi:WD40 repeat protein